MNGILKTSYYILLNRRDYLSYEKLGKLLAKLEDKLLVTENTVSKEELINDITILNNDEPKVYQKLYNDITSGLIYRGIKYE